MELAGHVPQQTGCIHGADALLQKHQIKYLMFFGELLISPISDTNINCLKDTWQSNKNKKDVTPVFMFAAFCFQQLKL